MKEIARAFKVKSNMLTYRHKPPNTSDNGNEKPPVLIFLHGIGADENDLFGLSAYLDARFFVVSVRAPFVLPYGGFAWFEINFEPSGITANVRQFEDSRQKFLEFVDETVAEHDLDAEKIYLCGFSQGAMISLSAVLSAPEKFAGVAALSGRAMPDMLPAPQKIEKFNDLPVLVQHGIYDPVLPVENGRATREVLSRLPVDLEYKEYPMAHEISAESLNDLAQWLKNQLD